MESNGIIISEVGKSLIDDIMEFEPTDKESAYVIAVHIASDMIMEKCLKNTHIAEIPSIVVALEGLADSLKNYLAMRGSDELNKRYETLRNKMSVLTRIHGDDNESI